jgi:hypothetical protein
VERRERERIGENELVEERLMLGQTAQIYPIKIIIAPK